MHPRLCRFTSETFYDGKLTYAYGLERQEILGERALRGSGLLVVEVAHEGNTNASPEGVDQVKGQRGCHARCTASQQPWKNDQRGWERMP
jgi:hypothetical protein